MLIDLSILIDGRLCRLVLTSSGEVLPDAAYCGVFGGIVGLESDANKRSVFGSIAGALPWLCGLITGCGWSSGLRIGRPAEEIKRLKGIQGMPWHAQAMKDVARCDKRRGTASRF